MTCSCREKIDCICPGCGKTHVLSLFWTGRTAPRKLCKNCKQIDQQYNETYYSFNEKGMVRTRNISHLFNPHVKAEELEHED